MSSDPYAPYWSSTESDSAAKKVKPPIPEATDYGLIFVGLALLLVLSRILYLNRRAPRLHP